MKRLFKSKWAMGILVSAWALGASVASAAPTECARVGTGTPAFSMAVASNFFEPGKEILALYPQTVEICHNASGTLINEIKAQPNRYQLFLSADEARPGQVPNGTDGIFTYAKGIPALWSSVLTSSQQLLSGGKVNKTAVTSLAVADPVGAPYGAAAKAILEDMNQWVTPSPTGWIEQFDNISLTKDAADKDVTTTNTKKAAFVSKAQICKQLTSPYKYAQFNDYAFKQNGVLVNTTNTTANSAAKQFKTYLLSRDVQQDLVDNKCYGSQVLNQ